MPSAYDNLLNDYFATTGINLGATFGGHEDLYRRAVGGGSNDPWNASTSVYGVANPGGRGKHYSNVESVFVNEYSGLRDLATMYTGRRYLADASETSNTQLEQFLADSDKFRAEVDAFSIASSEESTKFTEMQTQMDALKNAIPGAASKSSSLGAYSQAAKKQMEQTNSMIQRLKGAKAPQAQEIVTTFKDPITGRDLDFSAEFDESDILSDDFASTVRNMVTKDFNTLTADIKSELATGIKDAYGGFGIEDMNEWGAVLNQYSSYLTNPDYQGSPMEVADSGYTYAQLGQADQARQIYGRLDEFAESRALAEMSGTTEGYTKSRIEGRGYANVFSTGSQAFLDADRNAILEGMIGDTTTRLTEQKYKDMDAVRAEFDRRKSVAQSLSSDMSRRNELNKLRAEQLSESERQYTQMLAQQQQEYAQTMGQYGASLTDSGGITFTDTRPV